MPLPTRTGQHRLQTCFNLFTKEVLDGDEKPTCVKCQRRQQCTKSLPIQKFPRILVEHQRLFSPHGRIHGKINTTVNFLVTGLDLSPYSAGQKPCRYDLCGVTNHFGELYLDHCMAYCKHACRPFSPQYP